MATFEEAVAEVVSRVNTYKESIRTEEATKTSLVLPFITKVLGYDIFDPGEVVPEYTCDVGIKKGEKVDYAIKKNGVVEMLIEVKPINEPLRVEYANQLIRYFTAVDARIGILTNGQLWEFYTDLDKINVMDTVPFLRVDLLDISTNNIQEVRKLCKDTFDIDSVIASAKTLKYISSFKREIQNELDNPSPDFVSLIARKVYSGRITSSMLDFFTDISKKSSRAIINERINEKLKTAIGNVDNDQKEEDNPLNNDSEKEKYETTQEELYAFYMLKAILAATFDLEKITYQDRQAYFAVYYDNNTWKPICRFYFNAERVKYLGIFDENKTMVKVELKRIEDIYHYAPELMNITRFWAEGNSPRNLGISDESSDDDVSIVENPNYGMTGARYLLED